MSNPIVLVFNAGSSSLKFAVYDHKTKDLLLNGGFDDLPESPTFWVKDQLGKSLITQKNVFKNPDKPTLLKYLLQQTEPFIQGRTIYAAGHRVVHGGRVFTKPVRIDNTVLRSLKEFYPLAPLHQPFNIAIIEAFAEHLPHVPQVACFDTSFHRTQSKVAELFGLPLSYYEDGILRYGFHGLSYAYISSILPSYLEKKNHQRVIVAHLGNGASLCAMREGKSVATTMGFTALDGLLMGTRAGNIDPGVLLYLMESKDMTTLEITHLLYHDSGLKGISGLSGNMHDLMQSSEEDAKIAIDLFCFQAARQMGSLIPTINGLDALIFTAGIGENAPLIRSKISGYFGWLGVTLDEGENARNAIKISSIQSLVDVYVIPTNEDLMIFEGTGGRGIREKYTQIGDHP